MSSPLNLLAYDLLEEYIRANPESLERLYENTLDTYYEMICFKNLGLLPEDTELDDIDVDWIEETMKENLQDRWDDYQETLERCNGCGDNRPIDYCEECGYCGECGCTCDECL